MRARPNLDPAQHLVRGHVYDGHVIAGSIDDIELSPRLCGLLGLEQIHRSENGRGEKR